MRNASGYQNEWQSEREHKNFLHKTYQQEVKRSFTFKSSKTKTGNVKKKVLHVQSSYFALQRKKCATRANFIFWLIRSIVVVFFIVLVVFTLSLVFYIFFEKTIDIEEGFDRFQPWLNLFIYKNTKQ